MFPYPVLLAADSSPSKLADKFFRVVESYWNSFERMLIGEDLFIQLVVIGGAVVLSYALLLGLRPLFRRATDAIEERDDWVETSVDWVSDNLFRFLLVGLLWSASLWFDARNDAAALVVEQTAVTAPSVGGEASIVVASNYILIRLLASLATLLLVSRALPKQIKSKTYFKLLFFVLAIGLLLNLLGIWDGISESLNRMRLLPISDEGETRVTVLSLIKGALAILIIIPVTRWMLYLSDEKVTNIESVSPALRVLTAKLLKVLLIVGAVLFSISSLGVSLSTFAVLGGAVGLGLGFGFQKVVSNLISGVILLGDRSIKPGDVIEVDNTYGWINKLGARYASVITRDGTEHLIPNEMLITEKVVNWSFSDDNVRIKVPFGVSYSSDIHKAMELALEAGQGHKRVLDTPQSVVRLVGFGDNSVDFELRVWIKDPASGIKNLQSDIYVLIWDAFKANGVEFPFPQRDLHIRDSVPLEVKMVRE